MRIAGFGAEDDEWINVKNAERNENMNGSVVHDLQTYYAPLHLAYDCNRSLVFRVNVDI